MHIFKDTQKKVHKPIDCTVGGYSGLSTLVVAYRDYIIATIYVFKNIKKENDHLFTVKKNLQIAYGIYVQCTNLCIWKREAKKYFYVNAIHRQSYFLD